MTWRTAAFALACAAVGCDESAAFREPEPSWNRMLEQPRADAYEPSAVFDDGMAMRRPPPGTIAHDAVPGAAPPPPTRVLLAIGQRRFETFCAACHGVLGDGVSVVAEKMTLRKPPSLHEARFAALPAAAIADVVERGYGLMPSYADALSPRDRWAVADYVKALQLARGVKAIELPAPLRAELAKEAP